MGFANASLSDAMMAVQWQVQLCNDSGSSGHPCVQIDPLQCFAQAAHACA